MNTKSKLSTYLEWAGVIILLLLLVLTPLQNNPAFENGVTVSKTFFFTEGIILLLLIGCIRWLLSNQPAWISYSRIDLILTVLIIYIFIRSDFRPSPRMIDLIALTGFYLLFRRCRWKHFLLIFYAISVSGIIQSLYGLLQLYNILPSHSQFKLTGTFFNLGAYAAFITFSACISLVLIFYFKEKRRILIPQLNIILAIIILPITYNRAAWITLIVVAVFLYARFIKKYILYSILIVTGVLILSGVYYLKKDSANGRVLVWKVTAEMIRQHPVTGIGYDQFAAQYMNYQAGYLATKGSPNEKQLADNVYYAFNDLFQLTAELGSIGGFGILLLLFICFNVKRQSKFRYAGQGILLAYIIIGMFYYPHFILPLKMIGVLGLAILSRLDTSVTHQISRLQKKMTIALTMIILTAGIIFIGQLKTGYQYWGKAQLAYQHQRFNESLQYFNQALPYLQKDGEFLSEMGKACFLADSLDEASVYLKKSKAFLNNTVIETALGDISTRQHQFSAAENYYQQALNMVPNRFYTEYLLFKLYTVSNDNEKACNQANLILHKEVKVFSTAVQQIKDSARIYSVNNNCNH
jgi:O-antigen ligase/predicted negative regulator of RcsB-dependent stress response